jgi:hypothetical protein
MLTIVHRVLNSSKKIILFYNSNQNLRLYFYFREALLKDHIYENLPHSTYQIKLELKILRQNVFIGPLSFMFVTD